MTKPVTTRNVHGITEACQPCGECQRCRHYHDLRDELRRLRRRQRLLRDALLAANLLMSKMLPPCGAYDEWTTAKKLVPAALESARKD